jgi:DNA-binding transcriptional MocR family regulator
MELRLNVPPQLPQVEARIASAMRAVTSDSQFHDRLSYGSTAGREDDRDAGAQWLRPLLGQISADDVVICAGGASLLVALLTTFAARTDTVVTEALTYPGIRAVCRHFGMPLVGVAMDEEGIIPSALAETCEQVRPRVLYCTPTIQNPTTASMSPQRRLEIAQVADAFDLIVLEDDAYGMLPAEPLPPIATFAPARTFYMASISKGLSPALRIAYCVGPSAMRAQMTEGIRVVTFLASQPMAAVATQLINEGSASEILEDIRTESVARQGMAHEVLEGMAITASPYGPHLWLTLEGEWKVPELGEKLRHRGVPAKGDGFAVDGVHPQALRVALGASSSRDHLRESLEALKLTLNEQQLRVA